MTVSHINRNIPPVPVTSVNAYVSCSTEYSLSLPL